VKYLLLIYMNPAAWEAFTEEERNALILDHSTFQRELIESRELVSVHGLADADEAKSVRLRDGEPVVTDGPFVEAKEFLASVYLVDVRNMDRAVELAARCPDARYNAVEVRGLMGEIYPP
jgi:hypothetical protein